MRRRPRVAVLVPYWAFFEHSVAPDDLRADREALAATFATVLAREDEVVDLRLVDDPAAGREAGGALAALAPDAVVVVQSMAVPPAHALAALDALPATPLIVCAARRGIRVAAGFTHGDITRDGATVGTPQLTNVLHRLGRPHALVTWRPGDAAADRRVFDAVRAAAAAAVLRRARVLRVGAPIPGYDCVDCDPAELAAATGIELVAVGPAEVAEAYREAPDAHVAEIEAQLAAGWTLGPRVQEDATLERSVRFAAGLRALDERLAADAGVMNCHVSELRHSTDPGLAPCFALGSETSRGVPWSCSGDVVTVVAMLGLKALGAAALYHEIEALDESSGEALLANTGEHDLAFADPAERPALVRNRWYDGIDAVCGACALCSPAPGPATLVGFTPHAGEPSGFRFVVAEGEFTARRFPETGTTNAAFRFAGTAPVAAAWERWAAAGVNHHSAATPGHRGAQVAMLAAHLGVGCTAVTPLISTSVGRR